MSSIIGTPFGLADGHHGISFRSRKNLPVSSRGAAVASHTIVSAPSATERGAFGPPMSVRTQPGQTEFTPMPLLRNAAASWRVTALSAVFEMLYAGAYVSMSLNWPAPLDTLMIRPARLFASSGTRSEEHTSELQSRFGI